MLVAVECRRRPVLSEQIPDLLRTLCKRFEAIENLWLPGELGSVPKLEGADDIAPTAVLNQFLVHGIHGQIFFAGRFPKIIDRDVGKADDFITLRINTDLIDIGCFLDTVFPLLVDAFGAYRGCIQTDAELRRADFRRFQAFPAAEPDSDGRNGVIRLWPVCFMDDLLCRRSFGLSAEAVVAAVAPHCERAELRNGGALIIATTELLTGAAALDALDAKLRQALAGKN